MGKLQWGDHFKNFPHSRLFKGKMSLSLSNSLSFVKSSLVKLGKNSKNTYFSDFEPIFVLLFGGVYASQDWSKKTLICFDKIILKNGFECLLFFQALLTGLKQNSMN